MANYVERYDIPYLQAWRKAKDMTQEQLAKTAGVTIGTISRLEGKHSQITRHTAQKIAQALGIGKNTLLYQEPKKVEEVQG